MLTNIVPSATQTTLMNTSFSTASTMERDLLTLYKDLRSQYADKPDLNDLAVELCTDMRSTLDSRHRYLVMLGHWTELSWTTLGGQIS